MPRKLARENRIVLAHLLLDEGMPDAAHHGLAASRRDDLLADLRRTEVVEARRTGIGREHVLRDEGGREVHRNDVALLVHKARTVRIAVIRDAEGVLAGIRADERLQVRKRLRLERIRVMVREVAVVLAIEGVVGDHRVLERRGLGDAHAIREVERQVERTLQMRKGLHVLGVLRGDVNLRHLADAGRRLVQADALEDLLDVLDARRTGDWHGVRLAELAAVPFLRVVRGGNHHRTVRFQSRIREIAHRR